jgi:hypothetical protein
MSGPGSTARVWRQAAAIVGRYPAATLIPGAVLGAIAEAPHYFAGERLIIGNVLTYATAALAWSTNSGDHHRAARRAERRALCGGTLGDASLGEADLIDWERASLDSASIPAKRGRKNRSESDG